MNGRAQPEFKIEYVPIDQLEFDPANPRRISEEQLDALDRSMGRFGCLVPPVVRREDNRIIAGHQRVLVARRRGQQTIGVIYADLSLADARVLGIALNSIGGDFDEQLLSRLLADLSSCPEVDLSLTGLADDQIKRFIKSLEAQAKRDLPETIDSDALLRLAYENPRASRGELFHLGDHRLFCGDATSAEDVDQLLAGQKADMAVCDPPYHVSLGDHGGHQKGQSRRRLQNDALSTPGYEAFCRAWILNLLRVVTGALYLFTGSKELPRVSLWLEEAGAHWSDTLIWRKDQFVLGRAPYQRIYEPCWFGWPQGAKPYWSGGRKQANVWDVPRPDESPLHPTQKPIALLERAIENSSRAGDTVLDLFLGSGSTLIACERTGRICYGLEVDEHYASLAIARWEAFTGLKAEKVAT